MQCMTMVVCALHRVMSLPHTGPVSSCSLLVLILQVLCVQSQVNIAVLRSFSSYHNTTVVLSCTGGSGNDVSFFIRGEQEGSTRNISLESGNEMRELTIAVTTETEGIYSCTVGGETSMTEVTLVGENHEW